MSLRDACARTTSSGARGAGACRHRHQHSRAPATVRRYTDDLRLSFPFVLDLDGKINALYGVIGLPTTFLIGRDGRAVALAVGPRDWESPQARAIIEAMLAEPAPARDSR